MMDKDNLISVIVPVWKETFLNECINSLINQTYRPIEIILVDDGSLDNAGEICDKFAENYDEITVLHKANGGICSARNEGLKLAKGNFICFCDDDDYYEKDALEYMFNLMRNEIDYTSCECTTIDKNGMLFQMEDKFEETKVLNQNELVKKFCYKPEIVWGKLFKKKVLQNIYFSDSIKSHEDFEFMSHVISNTKKACIGYEIKYFYRKWQNTVTANIDKKRLLSQLVSLEMTNMHFSNTNSYLLKIYRFKIYYITLKNLLVLNQDNFDIEESKRMRKYMKKNLLKVLFDKKISTVFKFKSFALIFSPKVILSLIK